MATIGVKGLKETKLIVIFNKDKNYMDRNKIKNIPIIISSTMVLTPAKTM